MTLREETRRDKAALIIFSRSRMLPCILSRTFPAGAPITFAPRIPRTYTLAGAQYIFMDLELHPSITLQDRAWHILVAPLPMLAGALNRHLDLQRFEVLFVCGNYSRLLSSLDRRFTSLQVRRAFTVFQLMAVLEECCHSLLIIEHDPLLYQDAEEMVEYVSQAMRAAARESTLLLFSPASDPFLEMMTDYADRVFYFGRGPDAAPRPSAKSCRKAQDAAGQTTLEAF